MWLEYFAETPLIFTINIFGLPCCIQQHWNQFITLFFKTPCIAQNWKSRHIINMMFCLNLMYEVPANNSSKYWKMLPRWHLKCCLVIYLKRLVPKKLGPQFSLSITKPVNCRIVNHTIIKKFKLSDEFAKNCIKKYWWSKKLLAFIFGTK